MKRMIYLIVFGILTIFDCGKAQTAEVINTSSGKMFHLASSSEYIVTGIVSEQRSIQRKMSKEELVQLTDLSKTLGGVLYVFQVESLLTAKTDFEPNKSRPDLAGRKIFIFKERNTRFFQEEQYKEGQRYLIALKLLPDQKGLSEVFTLSEKPLYFEAFEGKKGLFQLSKETIPFVAKLKRFGKALSPTNKELKLKTLKVLEQSADSETRQSVKEAIILLEKNNAK